MRKSSRFRNGTKRENKLQEGNDLGFAHFEPHLNTELLLSGKSLFRFVSRAGSRVSRKLPFGMIPTPMAGDDSIPAVGPSGCHRQQWPKPGRRPEPTFGLLSIWVCCCAPKLPLRNTIFLSPRFSIMSIKQLSPCSWLIGMSLYVG